MLKNFQWSDVRTILSYQYTCAYCGREIASNMGYQAIFMKTQQMIAGIYICHHCNNPTYFNDEKKQMPSSPFGDNVSNISDTSVEALYNEARQCTSVNAYTAAILCCRKLLMHIAVSKGASEGMSFYEYVKYLDDKNLIPPGSKGWIDFIRIKGNEANHDIVIMQKEEAEALIDFSGMLLKILYEYPAKIKKP